MSSSRVSRKWALLQFVILSPLLAFLLGLVFGSYLLYLPCSIFFLLVALGLALVWLERSERITIKKGGMIFACMIAGVVWWVAVASSIQADADLVQARNVGPVKLVGEVV